MLTQLATEDWKLHPVSKALNSRLEELKDHLRNRLETGTAFGSAEPMLEMYRDVGLLRLINSILTLEILEIEENNI